MTSTPTPKPSDSNESDALDAALSDAPLPEMDLSNEPIFDDEAHGAAPPLASRHDDLIEKKPRPLGPPGPVFGASLTDAIWLLWRRATGNAVTEVGCRRCGYPAKHLTRRACPECGADFMTQGLIDPGDTRIGLLAVALGWTLAVLAAGVITRPLLVAYVLPTQFQRFVVLELSESNPLADDHRLSFCGEVTIERWPQDNTLLDDSLTTMQVYLGDRATTPAACDLILQKHSYSFRAGGKPLFSGFPASGKLDDDAIANWILFAGFEAKNDHDREAMLDHSVKAMNMLMLFGHPSATARFHAPAGMGVFDAGGIRQVYAERIEQRLVPHYVPLVFVAWGVLWILGIAGIMFVTRPKAIPAVPDATAPSTPTSQSEKQHAP